MNCPKCNSEIEKEDNFCHNCGEWTAKGYYYFKDNPSKYKMLMGAGYKQNNRIALLFEVMGLGIVLLVIMVFIQGKEMLKPFIDLKKEIFNYKYGYNTSLIITDNKYGKQIINSLESAKELIKKDMVNQKWQCNRNSNVTIIETVISNTHNIPSVNFCDIDIVYVNKINDVINSIYNLFPGIDGYLTNITITNSKDLDNYIAYFQPIYQFVNVNENINSYSKVNKTQILLNSYYFLNKDLMNKSITTTVGDNYYVNGATWTSTIAHEFGHYIAFVALLKYNNISNITYITKENINDFNKILELLDTSTFSDSIVIEALNKYNIKNSSNISIMEFTSNISKYASSTFEDKLNTDETIAEAVHDYYLHLNSASDASLEIINVLNQRLG